MPSSLASRARVAGLPEVPVWVGEVGSTQDVVRGWVRDGLPEGACAVTDRQSGGRGRLGRQWESPPGTGLQLSVLLRPRLPVARLALISLAAAVALREVLGERYGIKWPNDLLGPDGLKVAGVLSEAELTAGRVDAVVVGIGLNRTAAPAVPGAGHLGLYGAVPDPDDLAVGLVAALLARVAALEHTPAAVVDAWRAGDVTVGRVVRVGDTAGVADGVAEDGSLWVRTDDGARRRITTGDVSLVHTESR